MRYFVVMGEIVHVGLNRFCIIHLYNIHNLLNIISCKKDENGSVAYTVLLLVDGSRDVQIYFSDYISLMY